MHRRKLVVKPMQPRHTAAAPVAAAPVVEPKATSCSHSQAVERMRTAKITSRPQAQLNGPLNPTQQSSAAWRSAKPPPLPVNAAVKGPSVSAPPVREAPLLTTGNIPQTMQTMLARNQGVLRQVGNNIAVVGPYLQGRTGTEYQRRMATMPKYIPPSVEPDYLKDQVLREPLNTGQMRYGWWCTPYVERFANFVVANERIINDITNDSIMDVLAIKAQAFAYSRTEGLSMNTYTHHNMRERSLFTARALRYLGCVRKPMKGDQFDVTSNDGEWLFNYRYEKDNTADKEFFLHFVRAMMARDVKEDWLMRLVLDTSMEKYKTMPSDAMLNNEGMKALRQQRDYRTQTLHAHKEIKHSMTTTATIPCTVDKFAFSDEDPGGYVLVYGSGGVDCAMRHNWPKTYCVDPLYDGPPECGYKGTHGAFHSHVSSGILKLPFDKPSLITSDACAYMEQQRTLLLGARGNHALRDLTRAMCPDGTNKIAAGIVEYWLNQGYDGSFYMKSGVHNVYPPIFAEMKALEWIKTRPTNAEVIVHIKGGVSIRDNGASPEPGPDLTWARAVNRHNIVIFVANNQRMIHEKERTFPDRPFGYPANMDRLLQNARKNTILKTPPPMVIVSKRELNERKKMERGVDFDDLEHASDTFGSVSDSDGSDVEDYYN